MADEYFVPDRWEAEDEEGSPVELDESEDSQMRLLSSTRKALVPSPREIRRHYGVLRAFVSAFEASSDQVNGEVMEVLCDGLSQLVGSEAAEISSSGSTAELLEARSALKMYCFLLHRLVVVGERAASAHAESSGMVVAAKAASKGGRKKAQHQHASGPGGTWAQHRLRVLSALLRAAESSDAAGLWKMSSPDESYGNLFVVSGAAVMRSPANLKVDEVRGAVFRLFALATRRHPALARPAARSLVGLMANDAEHLPQHVADLVRACDGAFATELLREVGETGEQDTGDDTAATKSVANLIEALARSAPRAALRNLPLVVRHLEHGSGTVRSGVITALGLLISEILADSNKEEHDEEEKRKLRSCLPDLFAVLEERVADTNNFTRARTLQTWIMLVEKGCLDSRRWQMAASVAIRRLTDKFYLTRRYAIQLLTCLLQCNPYGPCLASDPLKVQMEQIGSDVKERLLQQQQQQQQNQQQQHELGDDDASSVSTKQQQDEESSNNEQQDKELKLFRVVFSALNFVTAVEEATPTLVGLLRSRYKTDLVECVEFFAVAHEFGVKTAADGVRNMRALVWSHEADVQSAVVEAYRRIYVGDPSRLVGPLRGTLALSIARSLVSMAGAATLAELLSLEKVLGKMVERDVLPQPVTTALWDLVRGQVPDANPAVEVPGALSVLTMLAATRPELVTANLGVLLDVAFQGAEPEQLVMTRHACVALQRMARPGSEPFLPRIYAALEDVLAVSAATEAALSAWFPAAEQAVSAFFALHPSPCDHMGAALARMSRQVFGAAAAADSGPSSSSWDLARFFFLLGHMGLKVLVALEDAESHLRTQLPKAAAPSAAGSGAGASASAASDLASVGAGHADRLAEMRAAVEDDLVRGRCLLSVHVPAVVHVCQNPATYRDPVLRASAALALCKLMCLHKDLCSDRNLQLLFTLLEQAADPAVRANIVVAFGDMACRFPLEVEKWSHRAFERLVDPHPTVRLNTTTVLSRLILQNMTKGSAKANLGKLALCVLDVNERVADKARTFFDELAKKEGSSVMGDVAKWLPDVIGQVASDRRVPSDDFRAAVGPLMRYVEKEKQAEQLVDQLCQRLEGQQGDVRFQRLVAYCLAQLPYGDGAVKHLRDGFRSYRGALADADVYASFQAALAKAKKSAGKDAKQTVDDLTEQLAECRRAHEEESRFRRTGAPAAAGADGTGGGDGGDLAADDDVIAQEAGRSIAAAQRRAEEQIRAGKRVRQTGGGRKKAKENSATQSADPAESGEPAEVDVTTKLVRRQAPASKKTAPAAPPPQRARNVRRAAATKRPVRDESSSSESEASCSDDD